MITVKDLDVSFRVGHRDVHAVRGVSFDVAKGETFGIVGESGSGKSTILRAIAGLVQSTSTALEVDGQPAARRRSRADRRKLQFVFQDPYASLHPRKTVDDILREPLEIHHEPQIEERVDCRHRRCRALCRSTASATRTSSRAGSASASPLPAP